MPKPLNRCACGADCYGTQCRQCFIANFEHIPRRLRKIWEGMMSRCHNKRAKDYSSYGAIGIRVCIKWHKWHTFAKWALSNGYAENLTIERIKNSSGYSPDNCRWATMKEQQRNRRSNHLVTAFGETKTITEWTEDPRCRVTKYALRVRLVLQGMDPEQAITHPPLNRGLKRRYKVFDGHS